MRGVGLVLIHKGRSGVLVVVNIIRCAQFAVRTGYHCCAGQRHEIGRTARHIEWVIRLQRNEDRAGATLGHEIETMIEELAEESHPGVERGGYAEVRRHIRNKEDLLVVSSAEEPVEAGAWNKGAWALHEGCCTRSSAVERCRRDCGGIVGRLVDDQVGDDARIGVEHKSAGLLVRRGRGSGWRSRTEETCRLDARRLEDRR